MLAKLLQIKCAQGFVHLMYDFLEMLGRIMKFMLPSSACGNGQRLLPVYAVPSRPDESVSMQMGFVGFVRTGRTRHLNPARHLFPWSPL
jgi:hypothetical protein